MYKFLNVRSCLFFSLSSIFSLATFRPAGTLGENSGQRDTNIFWELPDKPFTLRYWHHHSSLPHSFSSQWRGNVIVEATAAFCDYEGKGQGNLTVLGMIDLLNQSSTGNSRFLTMGTKKYSLTHTHTHKKKSTLVSLFVACSWKHS